MDFYSMLKKGMTTDEISEFVLKEMNEANERIAKEKEAEAERVKAEADRARILEDARAHLISAIGLYNEVFKFMEFNDEIAEEYAETLQIIENTFIKNPSLMKFYLDIGKKNENAKPKVNSNTNKDYLKYLYMSDKDWEDLLDIFNH